LDRPFALSLLTFGSPFCPFASHFWLALLPFRFSLLACPFALSFLPLCFKRFFLASFSFKEKEKKKIKEKKNHRKKKNAKKGVSLPLSSHSALSLFWPLVFALSFQTFSPWHFFLFK
jgi:hypothetical protein